MFNTVIEAIKRIQDKDNPSKNDQELLDYLLAEVDKEINLNLMNVMIYGERIGWDRIEGRIAGLLDIIRAAKESAAHRSH